MDAIDVQSTWEFTEDYPADDYPEVITAGMSFTVTSMWVDEDGVAHVTLDDRDWRDGHEKITVEDLRNNIRKGWVRRTNSPHEAWRRRNTNDIVVDGRFTGEGLSVSAYGENNELLDETWFTYDEMALLAGQDGSDFTFEL